MNKTWRTRLLSGLMAVLTVLLLLPTAAFAASCPTAASDQLLAFLKAHEGFLQYAQQSGNYYFIGYGQMCDPADYPNGITEEQASALLENTVSQFAAAVSSFAQNNALNLTQCQFDALVSFSYGLGTAWMSESDGSMRLALLNPETTDEELRETFCLYCKSGGVVLQGLLTRRNEEADMYLLGVYAGVDDAVSSTPTTDSSTGCICTEAFAGTYQVTTDGSTLNLRSGHGTGYSIVASMPCGASVQVTAGDGSWAHVVWNGISGYCSMDYLTLTASASGITLLKGDVNGNGTVDTDDAALVLQGFSKQLLSGSTGLTTAQLTAADVTGNGAVDSDDAVLILRYYAAAMLGSADWNTL